MDSKEKLDIRKIITNIVLVSSAFVWYLLVFNIISDLLTQQNASSFEFLVVIGANTGAVASSAFLGSMITEKLQNRKTFLKIWIAAGIPASLVPILLNLQNSTDLIVVSIFLGAYFGVGMPGTMSYYSENIKVENRGKTSGVTFLFIGLVFAVLGAFAIGNVLTAFLILSAVKLVTFLLFYFTRADLSGKVVKAQDTSFLQILRHKPFVLYFLPWLMFSLINYMTSPIVDALFSSQMNYEFLTNVVESVIIAGSAVFSGLFADRVGRKRLVIIGFIMLGFGYASLGLLPVEYSSSIYIIADGVAWGVFSTIFLLVLWGDIAETRRSDKFYLIGALPYLFSNLLRIAFVPYLSEVAPSTVFSFASFFLFLAVLPLVYAPETLPEKVLKDRDLNSYVGKALEKVKKESGIVEGVRLEAFEKKKETEANDCDNTKESKLPEELPEDEEARRLAEKYY